MKWLKLFGFREHTSISDTAYKAFAYFWIAAELLAKLLGFSLFFFALFWYDFWLEMMLFLGFSLNYASETQIYNMLL